jgi:hypothetical protein
VWIIFRPICQAPSGTTHDRATNTVSLHPAVYYTRPASNRDPSPTAGSMRRKDTLGKQRWKAPSTRLLTSISPATELPLAKTSLPVTDLEQDYRLHVENERKLIQTYRYRQVKAMNSCASVGGIMFNVALIRSPSCV